VKNNPLIPLSGDIENNNNFCYVHIPFCTSKCKYCRFASFWNLDTLKVNLYVDRLLTEIEKNKIDFKNLKSIYFGWWTPSVLNIIQLEKIIKALENKYWFDKNIEINIEATPVTISNENIKWWKKIWINRISSWVQTLNNDSLIEIWRGEKWDIIKALDNTKEEWFDNISIDFIIWLPYVKSWEIKKNIEYILDNYDFIKHISVYMLEEYYDVPEDKDSKFENITYPDNWNKIWIKDEDYLWEYIEVKEFLSSRWFSSYEISNFAKPWYECKHNKAYWDHSEMLAFWLWAHGFINDERYCNSEDFLKYYSWKLESYEKLDSEDLFLEKIMFQLRTSWLTNDIVNKLDLDRINYFIDNWYLEKKSNKIILLDKWVLVLDYILKEIV
jgi:oxygen-independent coproporphyrinogen III oxidase